MKTPVLIELAIQTVLVAFAGELRTGPFSLPSATHSLRVGLSLMKWGYEIDVCLGGFFHDVDEDTSLNREFIRNKFGDRAHFLMLACTLDPTLEEKGPGEDELYQRVIKYAEAGDLDPLRIKCADSFDNLGTNACLKPEWQEHAFKKGLNWHVAALRFFPTEALTRELGYLLQWEATRLASK
ncbi:MAG: hypothetical protein AAB365_01320 [Patescibacteria group bacterium]